MEKIKTEGNMATVRLTKEEADTLEMVRRIFEKKEEAKPDNSAA